MRHISGVLLLGAAVVAAGALVRTHFGVTLPGCGPESACHALAATKWGRVPWIAWPVSFLGLAYFASLLAAWLAGRGMPSRGLRWVVRAGAGVSLLFIGVMVASGRACPWCLAAHAANLAFLVLAEGSPDMDRRRGSLAFVMVFVAVTALLRVADIRHASAQASRDEAERKASAEKILAASQAGGGEAPARDPWGPGGFTGRYRRGPARAAIRIVALTDYQCPDCRRVEREIDDILAAHPDASFSAKHFPMCRDAAPGVPCNRAAPSSMHPNACWAARAAETAGILSGDRGFWAMHDWLFEHEGSFTGSELDAALPGLGFEPSVFTAVMKGEETLRRVRADVEEGILLGLHYTPMIFVNGVEFRGWQQPGALARTVSDLARTGPPARDASGDRPVTAASKYLEDWRAQPVRAMPPDATPHVFGTGTSREVLLFGDYLEPHTAAMDRALRNEVQADASTRYLFRHYPIDPACNGELPKGVRPEAVHPGACRAARAAEAAGMLGGDAAFWTAHAWLMEHGGAVDGTSLDSLARAAGLDRARLLATMESAAVTGAIGEDAKAARILGLTAVPMVFVDGRRVPRTTHDGTNVVLEILRSPSR